MPVGVSTSKTTRSRSFCRPPNDMQSTSAAKKDHPPLKLCFPLHFIAVLTVPFIRWWRFLSPATSPISLDFIVTMTKRAAEEMSHSLPLESSRTGPDFFGYYRAQVEELLSQEERISHQKDVDTNKSSTEVIGAELSELKREKLNALLRQCVRDSIPEVDEMQSRVESMLLMSQLSNKKPSTSPINEESVIPEEVDDDLQLLMKSDPGLVKEIVSKHSSDLVARLNDMQQQLEKVLDNVVTTCSLINRPMSRGEIRELKKSIKELPGPNLERVAGIMKNHYAALGKEMPDEVFVDMEEEDNALRWRLYYCVAAVKSARKLAS